MRNRCGQREPRRTTTGGCGMLPTVGAALIAVGLLLLLRCIPGWAWIIVAGAALIALGCALIRPWGR